MRIAIVQAGLGAGGAEKVANLIACHRLECGDEVHVIAVNETSEKSYFPYPDGIRVSALNRGVGGGDGIAATIGKLHRLRTVLHHWQPDAILSFLTKINILTGLASAGLGAPVIASERNNFKRQSRHLLWDFLAPLGMRQVSCLVMQTEAARACLPAALQRKAVVVPNLVSLPQTLESGSGAGSHIVAVGRLERQKGFDLLLEAFAQVAARAPGARLTIFGEGPERASLEAQCRMLGISRIVEMPGITKRPSAWISKGGIFVLSSRFEGFPNVLLEALAGGMATISFDCPWGPSEILGGRSAGILVPNGSVEGLRDAMSRLLAEPADRQRLAAEGPAVAARFAPSVVLEQWDAAIDAVAGRDVPIETAKA